MKRFFAFCSVLVCLVCPSCISDNLEPKGQGTLVSVGDELPCFSVITAKGQRVSRDSLLGHRSVVLFFNTRCADCQMELPRVDSLYRAFSHDKSFKLICIARQEKEPSIANFWKEKKLTMPYSPQADRSVFQLFAYTGIPRIYISSPDGVVRYVHDDTDMPSFQTLVTEMESMEK